MNLKRQMINQRKRDYLIDSIKEEAKPKKKGLFGRNIEPIIKDSKPKKTGWFK